MIEVNTNASGSWLEPYIGFCFFIERQTKDKYFFKMDSGFGIQRTESAHKSFFNHLNS